MRIANTTLAIACALTSGCIAVNDYDRFRVRDGGGSGECTESCDDENPCTTDACVAGACEHTPRDGQECGVNATCAGTTCDCAAPYLDCGGDSGCEVDPRADDANCGSCGNACTDSSCMDGSCVACETTADCPTDDGRTCTLAPTCTDGVCEYALQADTCLIGGTCYAQGDRFGAGTASEDPCLVCDPATNTRDWSASPGTSCDDDLFCTATDTCTATGSCEGVGSPCRAPFVCNEGSDRCECTVDADCPDTSGGNECMMPVCTSGVCGMAPRPDGTTCHDGRFCTGSDSCVSGACTMHSGTPPVCETLCDGARDQCCGDVGEPCCGADGVRNTSTMQCCDGMVRSIADVC